MTTKAYYEANKERCAAYGHQYRQKNKDRLRPIKKAYAVGYYAANKERFAMNDRAWRDKNRAEKPWLRVLQCVRSRCKINGRTYALSNEWAAARWTGHCELTGLPFVIDTSRTPGPKPFSPTVDRIDSGLDYEPDNCRFVLYCVNNFRGTMGDSDMRKVARAILRSGHGAQVAGAVGF